MPDHPADLPLFSRAEVAKMLDLPYGRVWRAAKGLGRELTLQEVHGLFLGEDRGVWEMQSIGQPVAYRPLPGIVVRPGVGWGRVCMEGTGIKTAVVASRIRGGESIQEVADDFGVNEALVRAAVEFEGC